MAKNKAPNKIQYIAERFGITAREARDIATAVNNAAEATARNMGPRGGKAVRKDLVKQVKEVGKAAIKGETGTPAGKFKDGKFKQSKKLRDYPRTYNVMRIKRNKNSKQQPK